MFKFENLNVYQESLMLVKGIYIMTRKFPKEELFGLSNQVQRAAVSIVLNISEGSSRTIKDFKHFLDLSRGSCYECVACISIAKDLNYISAVDHQQVYDQLEKVSRMISGLKNSLKES